MVIKSVSSTELAILFRLVFRKFLTGLNLGVEVLQWSKLDDFGGKQNETKINPQLNVCASLADSYSSSQATASEIEGCS